MFDEDDLIHSPLQQTFSAGGQSVEILIYRMPDSGWILEVVDAFGGSTVWDDEFETDHAALDEVMRMIREEGIEAFVGEPYQADDLLGEDAAPPGLSEPLSVLELEALDAFLASDAASDETMLLDRLDGYLTAIAIGPTSLNPSQWYPGIWGPHTDDAPHFESLEQAQLVMQTIMRFYNGIIGSLEEDADTHRPIFEAFVSDESGAEYIDAEMWACGFMEGVELCLTHWRPLFDDAQGREWLEPIRLLGASDLSDGDLKFSETPEQRDVLARQIPASLAAIYRFWLPYREAAHQLLMANTIRREHPKVGRNDPCPCGSGKKFKKCCGGTSTLH